MKKNLLFLLALVSVQYMMQAQQTAPGQSIFDEAQEYYYGLGKPYNPEKAFQLFWQAARAGNPAAMNSLGNMYAGGLTVPVNITTAIEWYEKAGQNGNAMAYNNIAGFYRTGYMVPQDFVLAFRYYKMGVALNDDDSKGWLAYFYFKGLGGEQNYRAAFNLYKQLSEKNHANAQYFLGICYRNGYGTTVNTTLAKEWLSKASVLQDNQAMHELNNEPLPENAGSISPVLQNKVAELKGYQEKYIAANTNNISGAYAGYAVYYDFSKTFVHKIVPLSLVITRNGANYEAIWKEGDSLTAHVKGSFAKNNFTFDSSSQYTRNDYYSYRNNEKYLFDNAALQLKYLDDSMYLSGDVRFYSVSRKEPGQPMYITLSKKATDTELPGGESALSINPNPVTSVVNARFTLEKPAVVQLQLLNIKGNRLQQNTAKSLPAGTYTYQFDVQNYTPGSYVLELRKGKKTETKIFLKF